MITKSIVWILLVLVPVMAQGETHITSNEVGNVCSIASNTDMGVCLDNVLNSSVTNIVVDDFKEEQQRGQEQDSLMNIIKKARLLIGLIILLFVALIDWCSKHTIWRFVVQAVKWIVQKVGSQNGTGANQHNATQKAGNQNIKIGDIKCGDNATVSIGILQSPKQHNDVSNKSGDCTENNSFGALEDSQSAQQSRWNEIEKKYNPYKLIKVKATIRQIVEENLCVIDMLRATCPKKHIPICVIDDKDDEKYREGLKTLGYENVTIYPKCPVYDVLKPFAIVIFDVRGVGNAAGKDGFSLAVTFKSEHPLKVVGVRSNFLQDVSETDRGKLNFALEKKRDLCDQLAPVLNAALKDVGDPIAMWKKARMILLETSSVRELALIEHEYVQAIRLLSHDTDVLPGEWISGVNRLLKRNIF